MKSTETLIGRDIDPIFLISGGGSGCIEGAGLAIGGGSGDIAREGDGFAIHGGGSGG